MDDGIREKLRYLGLYQLEERWDQILVEGVEMSAPRLLDHLVNVLYDARVQRACANRLKAAKIPEPWVMATYPFDQQPKLNKRKIVSLHDSLDIHDEEAKPHPCRADRGREDRHRGIISGRMRSQMATAGFSSPFRS